MSSSTTPFATFSHMVRIQLIKALSSQPLTVTDMAQIVDLSLPEVSRHLSKLMDHQFIEKSAITRKYELTHFGQTTLTLFSPLDFIFNNIEFFQSHDIAGLPFQLMSKIHLLAGAEFISGTGFTMQKMQQLTQNTSDMVQIMVDQPFPFGKSDVHVRFILPMSFLEQNPDLKPEGPLKSLDVRIHPNIPVALAISDNSQGILFFSNGGLLDYSAGFFCTDTSSLSFLRQIWDYYWETGEIPELR